MMQGVPIGEAARQSGVKAPTIRYYEQIGLLAAPPRSKGNRHEYNPADLRRLAFIRHARELGFEIEAIRALVTLQDDPSQPCGTAGSVRIGASKYSRHSRLRGRVDQAAFRMASTVAIRRRKSTLRRSAGTCWL